MFIRLTAILMLALQPLLLGQSWSGRDAATERDCVTVTCCGEECACCRDGGACACAAEPAPVPKEPTPAPTAIPGQGSLRFFLPTAPVLFVLETIEPQALRVGGSIVEVMRGESHQRSLARLCVWRT